MKPLFPPERVQAVNEANAAIREALRRGPHRSPAHLAAVHWFHEALRAVWPPELGDALQPPFDDPTHLDFVLRFLEESPFFFRSGYVKQRALSLLPRWRLDTDAQARLARIVLASVDGPPREEFRRYCRVSVHADRTILIPELLERLDHSGTVAWQAFCVAHSLLGHGFPTPHQRHTVPGPQIDAVRERLRLLLEGR